MIWDNLLIALQAIRANKMRSLLTMLGIIIGVAAVIAVVSIVQGLNYVIATQFEGVGVTYIMVFPRQDLQDPDLAGREAGSPGAPRGPPAVPDPPARQSASNGPAERC